MKKPLRIEKRKRVAMTLSVPAAIAREYGDLARRQSKNKSEIFREMWRVFKESALREEFYEVQRRGADLARRQGVLTEEDVEGIVFEGR